MMNEQRREEMKRIARQQAGPRKNGWVLIDMEKLPVFPEVQRARGEWEGQEIWFQMPKGCIWRRGKVKHIYNSSAVLVVVYQKGTPGGLKFAFDIQHIPVFLRHV